MARDRDRLQDYEEEQVSFWIAGPLNARLDALVERMNSTGERTNRKEILSALILSASEGPEELASQVRRLRRAQVKEVAVAGFEKDRFLNPAKRPPGPRPRKRSS